MNRFLLSLLFAGLFFLTSTLQSVILPVGLKQERLKEEKIRLQKLEEEIAYWQNLLELKSSLKNLYEMGNLESVRKNFNSRNSHLAELLKDKKLEESELLLSEQEMLFAEIGELAEEILFNKAQLATQKGQIERSKIYLEQINQPEDLSAANLYFDMLIKVYLQLDENEKILTICQTKKEDLTADQRFIFANANYNLGRYEDAGIQFSQLENNRNYNYRAKSLSAFCKYWQGDKDKAISLLRSLAAEPKAKQNEKNFVFLNLTRIAVLEQDTTAFSWVRRYLLANEEPDDEILFEIASYYYQFDQPQQAISILKKLTEKPLKSAYYIPARFLIMVCEAEISDQNQIEEKIAGITQYNLELADRLKEKYHYLDKFYSYQKMLTQIDSSDLIYNNLKTQLNLIEIELAESNEQLQDFYGRNLHPNIRKLIILEKEYLNYSQIIAQLQALTLLAQTQPQKVLDDYLKKEISFTDAAMITVQVIQYLQAKPVITANDYELARLLATEKILLLSNLDEWQLLLQFAQKNNLTDLTEKIDIYTQLLAQNSQSYDNLAILLFRYQKAAGTESSLAAEFEKLEQNKHDLIALRADLLGSYENLISRRLERETAFMEQEFDFLRAEFEKITNKISGDIKKENQDFRFQYLDFLFKQNLQADRQFERMQADQ
jgi:hypothetical protein